MFYHRLNKYTLTIDDQFWQEWLFDNNDFKGAKDAAWKEFLLQETLRPNNKIKLLFTKTECIYHSLYNGEG